MQTKILLWLLGVTALGTISSPSDAARTVETFRTTGAGTAAKPLSSALIEEVIVRPNTGNRSLNVTVRVVNAASQTRKLQIRGALSAGSPGATWRYPTLPVTTFTLQGGERRAIAWKSVPWTPGAPSWWWPNVPFRPNYHAPLHRLQVTLLEANGRVNQETNVRFGFCAVERKGAETTLNGVPVHLRGDRLEETALGVNAFRRLPGFLPPTSTASGWPGTVRNLQRLNLNLLRLNPTSCTPYMLNVCDELGLLVIPEIPVDSGTPDKSGGIGSPSPASLRAWIQANRNHPAILQWGLEQSTASEDRIKALTALCQEVDNAHPCVVENAASAMQDHPGSVQAGLVLRGLRETDALDSRPFSMIPVWPGVISGLTPVGVAVSKLTPASADRSGQSLLNPAHPWEFPAIQLLQRSLAPVAAYDAAFDAANVMTNGKGEWPARQPVVPAEASVTRQVTLFNDEFAGEKLILSAAPRVRIAPDRFTTIPTIRRLVIVPRGGHVTVPVTFPIPACKENTALEVVWSVQKAGVERYRESNYYVIVPAGTEGAEAVFVGRDDKTQGNWLGVYGLQGFMIPRLQGRATFQAPSVQLVRGTSMTMGAAEARHNELRGNEIMEGQQQLARFEDKLTVDDPRLPLDGPGATVREPIAFRALGGAMFFRIDTTDGKPRVLSLYFLDYFRKHQAEDVDILDLNGNRLETLPVRDYENGAYIRFRFRGTVLVRVTSLNLEDPLVSSIFVDPVSENG